MDKAVIYLPEAGIFEFLRCLSFLCDSLKKKGWEIYLVNCNGTLLRCPMLASDSSPYVESSDLKLKKCNRCKKNIDNYALKYGYKILNAQNFLNDNSALVINKLLSSSNTNEIVYKNLNVSKIALHDFFIETKKIGVVNLTKEENILYKKYICSTVLSLDITENIIKKLSPKIVLTFNPYSQCIGVHQACLNKNVDFRNITNIHHLGSNWSLFHITEFSLLQDYIDHMQNWINYKNLINLPESKILHCCDDILFRFFNSGSHIFSAKKQGPDNIYSLLGLNPEKKIITLFTSSYDERIGLLIEAELFKLDVYNKYNEVFDNQVNWLEFIKDYSNTHPDYQFVIKIHPREGLNGGSDNLKILKSKFDSNFENENIKILWPETNISTYDLLEIADACIINGSTVGLEACRLGIPVINITSFWGYSNEGVIETAYDKEDFIKKLNKILENKVSIDYILNAWKYYYWKQFVLSLYYPSVRNSKKFPRIPKKLIDYTYDVILNPKVLFKLNIDNLLSNKANNNMLENVRFGLRRIIYELYFHNNKKKNFIYKFRNIINNVFFFESNLCKSDYKDYVLKFSYDSSKIDSFLLESKKHKNRVYIVEKGVKSILVKDGKKYERTSKLISNLARVCSESNP